MNGPSATGASRPLRVVLAVGLACALTWSISQTLGLGSATAYGVVVAALLVRPDLQPNPPPLLAALPVVVAVGLSLGTLLKPLLQAPMVWQFAVVTAIAQLLGQALPDRLMALRNLLAVLAVLPLLGSNATWLGAWHQLLAVGVGILTATLMQQALTLPSDRTAPERSGGGEGEARHAEQADAAPADGPPAKGQAAPREPELPARTLAQRFADPFFWRRLVVAMLALSIGLGVGASNPKYLYFGVVLLLGESLGATLERVRDRMLGVSLGVLMPWLVFNTFSINALAVGVVMGGTTALLMALGLSAHQRTALISSGVTFVGYGALTDWYIPSRWLDYLLGCGLALLVCLLVRPVSALRRFQQLADGEGGLTPELRRLLPSALEEARLLGQERPFRARLEHLEQQPRPG